MNARAMVVTSNERDFREAVRTLGLKVMTPVKFLEHLTNGGTEMNEVTLQLPKTRLYLSLSKTGV